MLQYASPVYELHVRAGRVGFLCIVCRPVGHLHNVPCFFRLFSDTGYTAFLTFHTHDLL